VSKTAEPVGTTATFGALYARYRAVVAASGQMLLYVAPNGAVRSVDGAWTEFTGQSASQACGNGWIAVLHSDDRLTTKERLDRRLAQRRPFTLSCRVWHSGTQEYRLCEAHVAPVRRHHAVTEFVVSFQDVNERFVMQTRERVGAERFRKFVSSNLVAVGYGVDNMIVDGNDAFLELLGATRRDLKGGLSTSRFVARDVIDARLQFEATEPHEYEISRVDGSSGHVLAAGVRLDPDPGWLVVAVDITSRHRAAEEAVRLSLHDALTGLPNRRLLVDRIEHAFAQSTRTGKPFALLVCDVDRFKTVNDVYGHAAGDHTLQVIATRLHGALRQIDTIARVGGDEFVVLLEELSAVDDAEIVAGKLRRTLTPPIDFDGTPLHVTVSIGVVGSDGDAQTATALLDAADDAMYQAKASGGDQVFARLDTSDGRRSARREDRWIDVELNRALKNDALDLAFQPVIDLNEERVVATEALLRFTVDGRTIPTPTAIAVAERTGSILRLSDWIMHNACRRFSAARQALPPADMTLHINVSAHDLADPDFVARVDQAIVDTQCAPASVCLEITETAMLLDSARAHDALTTLRARGFSVAIDDFGTGYAPLARLCDLPADTIKIDQAFVSELERSPRHRAIVSRTIQLAHDLGLVVIAEGIETPGQLALLHELECDRGQGFIFARPGPTP
jgi:diguanylate cyclase (GGDEF)-like protein/PAS domain S-box-containing protein